MLLVTMKVRWKVPRKIISLDWSGGDGEVLDRSMSMWDAVEGSTQVRRRPQLRPRMYLLYLR